MAGYIGPQPVPQATQHRESFTATSGQTSFATAGYTPQFLDVYLNGVHLLDGTDYTATNGSDVVLTTGAATDDILEVVSYTPFEVADQTFTGDTSTDNLSVTGSFTSQGIDDNATSTAMTLDGSGNLLVGTTDAAVGVGNTNTGLSLANSGYAAFSRTGSPTQSTLFLNKNSNDGSIVNFAKDGTTVGSISVSDGDRLNLNSGSMGFKLYDDAKQVIPTNGSGANSDAQVVLGSSSVRFKDLYLSGGVYLGGTGSANKLDDYEEGTWTPSLNAGTASFGDNTYVKVGRQVIATLFVTNFSDTTSSTGLTFNGLPYASDGDYIQGSVSLYRYVVTGNGGHHVAIYGGGSSTNCTLYTCRPNTSNYEQITHNDLTSSSANFFLKIIYTTNS